MSWLLFLDESGHDHRQMPYEVRGGLALHASKIWPFEQAWNRLEADSFGTSLHQFGKEIKGSALLDSKRVRLCNQAERMDPEVRRKLCRSFLTKGLEKLPPNREEFSAYGQACWEMATGIFQLIHQLDGVVFACMIPRGVKAPRDYERSDYLRKDHVFLLERYYYFLEEKQEEGLLARTSHQLEVEAKKRLKNRGFREVLQTMVCRGTWRLKVP